MKVDQARRLKGLERENAQLHRAVANLSLDKLILEEAAMCETSDPRTQTHGVWCPIRQRLDASERHGSRVLGQARSTQRSSEESAE